MEPGETRRMDASYTVQPERTPKERASGAMVLAVIASCLAGIAIVGAVVAIVLYAGARSTITFQGNQIHGLDKNSIRQSQEIAGLSTKQAQTSAQLAASDPASDSSLITCSDLRHMNLTTTTGGSVSAVPGTVQLNTSPARMPGHCR